MLGEERELPYRNHGGPTFNPGRLARLLRHVAEKIDYQKERPANRAVATASHFTFGGYGAHAVEISKDDDGAITIEKIVAAMDCGLVVNPLGAEAQLQGATVDGLSTALNLEITLDKGRVVQSNFHDYRLLKIGHVPVVFETSVLPWGDEPAGVGEMGIPSIAPALTNAIFALTGKRIRKLPIADQVTFA
jgi:isoquinoline 1-oxidoreductase beta subunit